MAGRGRTRITAEGVSGLVIAAASGFPIWVGTTEAGATHSSLWANGWVDLAATLWVVALALVAFSWGREAVKWFRSRSRVHFGEARWRETRYDGRWSVGDSHVLAQHDYEVLVRNDAGDVADVRVLLMAVDPPELAITDLPVHLGWAAEHGPRKGVGSIPASASAAAVVCIRRQVRIPGDLSEQVRWPGPIGPLSVGQTVSAEVEVRVGEVPHERQTLKFSPIAEWGGGEQESPATHT